MSLSFCRKSKKLTGFDPVSSASRRFRANDVLQYPRLQREREASELRYQFRGIVVNLLPEPKCTCPDFVHRQAACKHIFAAASLAGDTSAVLTEAPSAAAPVKSSSSSKQVRRSQVPSGKWRNPVGRPQNIRVGKHFMLSDFLYSETAMLRGIPNPPPPETGPEIDGMRGLCQAILDPVVERFGPVSLTYAYVSPQLAQNLRMGGPLHSYRLKGKVGGAADVVIHGADYREAYEWVMDNCSYDRLIMFPGSEIICLGWTDKPRRHAKQWVISSSGDRRYIDYEPEQPRGQLSLV